MNEQNQNINHYEEEQEIDILAIVKRLWDKRKLILIVTCCFMVLGLFVALFSPKVYTSSVTFVPQSAKKGHQVASHHLQLWQASTSVICHQLSPFHQICIPRSLRTSTSRKT